MKCVEVEGKLDLMFDDEVDLFEKQAIQQHFEYCNSCYKSYRSLQKLKIVSQRLPLLLPTKAFDKQILQAFANHHQVEKVSFWKTFLIPVPVFATGLALFGFGLAGAFWVGRTTTPPQIVTETVTVEKEILKTEEKIVVEKSKPEIVTVTKYVEVPVIKEVKQYISMPKLKNEKSRSIKNSTTVKSDDSLNKNAFITQIDFEKFQPVSEIKMKVIKKGEPNE